MPTKIVQKRQGQKGKIAPKKGDEMYDKKIVVLSQLNGLFAKPNKRICGMLKLIFDKNCHGNVYVCNANSPFLGQWLLVLKIQENIIKIPLETFEQTFTLDVEKCDKISVLLAFSGDVNYPVASGSLGRFDNQIVAMLDEIVQAKTVGNVVTFDQQPTQYEQFVASADNFYPDDLKVDVEGLKKLSQKRLDAVKDYSTAFERYYSAKTGDNYYQTVKEELTRLLITFPPFEPLMKTFDNSFFVKIDCKDKYFALGVLTNDGQPQYLCYAIPGERKVQDKDFVFLDNGEQGFWLLYQDADTGQITVKR